MMHILASTYYRVTQITYSATNKILASNKLPPVDKLRAWVNIKLVTMIFVLLKHFIISLLTWFPMDFEAQKSLMLYLLLPQDGGLFSAFSMALNPKLPGQLAESFSFVQGATSQLTTQAGHAALTLASGAWAETLEKSNLVLSVGQQKQLLAKLTQPFPLENPASGLTDCLPLNPLNLASKLTAAPLELAKAANPLDLAGKIPGAMSDLPKSINPLGYIPKVASPLEMAKSMNPLDLAGKVPNPGDLANSANPLNLAAKLPNPLNLPSSIPDLKSGIPSLTKSSSCDILPGKGVAVNPLASATASTFGGVSSLFGGSLVDKVSIPPPSELSSETPLGHQQLHMSLAALQKEQEAQTKLPIPGVDILGSATKLVTSNPLRTGSSISPIPTSILGGTSTVPKKKGSMMSGFF